MPPKRALVAVHDTAYLEDLVRTLQALGTEVLATTANAKWLATKGVVVTPVANATHVDPIFAGKVETLDPRVHAGVLSSGEPQAVIDLASIGADEIDLVAVNFSPLAMATAGLDAVLASVDLQHVALAHTAAVSYARVVVLVEPRDYGRTTKRILDYDEVPVEWRRAYAIKALSLVARYEAAVARMASSFDEQGAPRATPTLYTLVAERASDLRAGDNAQQAATLYTQFVTPPGTLPQAILYGMGAAKVPTVAQLRDVAAAMDLVAEIALPTFALYARGAPVAVACAETVPAAFAAVRSALAEPWSSPVLACNRQVDAATAQTILRSGLPCLVAPSFETEAVDAFQESEGLTAIATRGLLAAHRADPELFAVPGGVVLEARDATSDGEVTKGAVVTQRQPTESELRALELAWKIAKHAPSDAVVVVRAEDDGSMRTVGVSASAGSRRAAVEQALARAGGAAAGAVLASDGPIEERAEMDAILGRGILAVAHPGSAADAANIAGGTHVLALIATGITHFHA